jgi:hypothetical protein
MRHQKHSNTHENFAVDFAQDHVRLGRRNPEICDKPIAAEFQFTEEFNLLRRPFCDGEIRIPLGLFLVERKASVCALPGASAGSSRPRSARPQLQLRRPRVRPSAAAG